MKLGLRAFGKHSPQEDILPSGVERNRRYQALGRVLLYDGARHEGCVSFVGKLDAAQIERRDSAAIDPTLVEPVQ